MDNKIIVCQQPNYFPWLGYLELLARADTLIVLDSVQWIKQGRQHRTRIGLAPGQKSEKKYQWLSLPVLGKGHREKTISEMKLDSGQDWKSKHWKTIRATYGRKKYFKSQLEPKLQDWFENQNNNSLRDVAIDSTKFCLNALGYSPKIIMASDLKQKGSKSDLLVSLVQAVSGKNYYSGVAPYVKYDVFREAGIQFVSQRWKHPVYDQGKGTQRLDFVSHLSLIDVLVHVPIDQILEWFAVKPWSQFDLLSKSSQ